MAGGGGLGERLRRRRAADPRLFRAQVLLGVAVFGLLLYLAVGDKPWSEGIAERLRRGVPVRPIDYARTWGWWTAAANALVVGGLLATARRWLGAGAAPASAELAPGPAGGRWGFALVVAGAVASAACLAYPRLSFSLWDDELYSVRRHIDGFYVAEGDGTLRFEAVRWRDTFWNDSEANNHVPFSILSRLSLGVWRAVARPETALASEAAVRFPSYLAGLAGIAVSALLAARLGSAAAGAMAAWLLALHPWYLRYASEARGYGLLLLLVPLCWLLLVRALQRGTWGRWLAYGAAQCALLWVHAGMLYQLALTNLAALAAVWHVQRGAGGRPGEQLARFAVVGVASAALYAQLMVPNLAQILAYLGDWQGRAGVPGLRDVLSHLFCGFAWRANERHYVSLAPLAAQRPLLVWGAAGLVGLSLAVGAARLARCGGVRALLLPALVLPAPLLYVASWLRGDRFYVWYVVFALPGLAVLAGMGAGALPDALRGRRARGLAYGALALCVAIFLRATDLPRREMRTNGFATGRESVLLTRPTLDPFAPENQRILTASFYYGPGYYDPLVRSVTTSDELLALMAEADARGIPLFVNNGRPGAARRQLPELARLVEQDERFERVATLRGAEKRGLRVVYRYRGAGAGRHAEGPPEAAAAH